MSISLQKANFWKRISAYLCDIIVAVILTVGFATVFSAVIGYSKNSETLEGYYAAYEEEYDIDLSLSQEEINALPQEEKDKYTAANEAFGKDKDVLLLYNKMFTQTLLISTFSILAACIVCYFVVPMLFKNGQTLGKKVFGLAVIRSNCVKLTNPILFIRSILGLYTIETMIPVLIIIMIYFGVGSMGFGGILVLFGLFIWQIISLITTKNHSAIHDLLSDTVVVDFSSQRIFESEQALIAYKEELHAQEVAKAEQAQCV